MKDNFCYGLSGYILPTPATEDSRNSKITMVSVEINMDISTIGANSTQQMLVL